MTTQRRVESARLPPVVSGDAAAIAQWAREEFDALARALNAPPLTQYDVLHEAPSKPRPGMVAYADGSDWDPGSGEGLYVYKTAGWSAL